MGKLPKQPKQPQPKPAWKGHLKPIKPSQYAEV